MGIFTDLLSLYHWSSTPETLVDMQTQAWIDATDRGGLKKVEIIKVTDATILSRVSALRHFRNGRERQAIRAKLAGGGHTYCRVCPEG